MREITAKDALDVEGFMCALAILLSPAVFEAHKVQLRHAAERLRATAIQTVLESLENYDLIRMR